jgi:hypothetical protein
VQGIAERRGFAAPRAGREAVPDRRLLSRRTLVVVALVAVAGAWLIQTPGANQAAHYVSIQSLASGHHNVDRLARDASDLAWTDGHYHAAKSPGLDLLLAPVTLALRGAGVKFDNAPPETWSEPQGQATSRDIWLLTMLGALLPAIILMIVVSREAERLRPGTGPIAAVATGAGSMMLPFSSLLFSHALSTTLGFAGFTLLARAGRDLVHRPRRVAAAGALLGFAVITEYPLGLLAMVSFAYIALTSRHLRTLFAFSAGGVAGVLPLPVYAWWAYGDPLHSTYAGAVAEAGKSGHDVLGANAAGFFGITRPHVHALFELLLSGRGLFVATPIAVVGIVGLVELARRGERAYAVAGLATFGAFLLYDCAYWIPFGGATPGPRFLIPVLPFLSVGVAVAWASMRRVVAPLLIASVVTLTVQTSTGPLHVVTTAAVWWYRLHHGLFVSTLGDATGTWQGETSIALFFAAIGAALVIAIGRPRFSAKGCASATTVFAAWFLLSELSPPLFHTDFLADRQTGAYVAAAIAAIVLFASWLAARGQCLRALATLAPLWLAFLPAVRGSAGANAILVALSATVIAAPQLRPYLARARTVLGSVGEHAGASSPVGRRVAGIGSLALLYAGVRLWMFWPARAGVGSPYWWDAGEYLRVSRLSLLSTQFYTEHKPFGYPLVLKIFGENQGAVVWMQLALSVASWLFLAAVAARCARGRVASYCIAATLLAFSCTGPIAQWDALLLTESPSISILAMLLGLAYLAITKPTAPIIVSLIAAALVFSSLRDANGAIGAVVVLLVAVASLRPRRLRTAAYLVAGAASCVLLVTVTTAPARWEVLIADQVDKRVMLDPTALAYFRAHGMPTRPGLSAILYENTRTPTVSFNAAASLRRDPRLREFLPWFLQHGNATYRSYLIDNPAASLGVPIRRFPLMLSDAGLAHYRAPHFRTPPNVLEHFFYPSNGKHLILFELCLGALAALGLSRRIFTRDWMLPLGLMLSALPLAILVWDGEPSEVPRHVLLAGIGSRLAFWLGCWLIAAPVLQAIRNPRHQAAKTGVPATAHLGEPSIQYR